MLDLSAVDLDLVVTTLEDHSAFGGTWSIDGKSGDVGLWSIDLGFSAETILSSGPTRAASNRFRLASATAT